MRKIVNASFIATALITAAIANPAFAQTTKRPVPAGATSAPAGSAMTDAGIATPPTAAMPAPATQTGVIATPQTGATGTPTSTTGMSGSNGNLGSTGTAAGMPAGSTVGSTVGNTVGNGAGSGMTTGSDTLGTSTSGTSAAGTTVVTGNTNPTALDHAQAATHANINAAGHAVGTSATVDTDVARPAHAKKSTKAKKDKAQ